MNIEDQLKKVTAESEYWFSRFQYADVNLERTSQKLAASDAVAEDFREKNISLAMRLELICDIQKAMQKTGAPMPSWTLGGVTENALRELRDKASEYRAPQIINDAKFNLVRPRGIKMSRGVEDYVNNLEATVRQLMAAVQEQEIKK